MGRFRLSVCLSVCPAACDTASCVSMECFRLSVFLSVSLSVCLSVCPAACDAPSCASMERFCLSVGRPRTSSSTCRRPLRACSPSPASSPSAGSTGGAANFRRTTCDPTRACLGSLRCVRLASASTYGLSMVCLSEAGRRRTHGGALSEAGALWSIDALPRWPACAVMRSRSRRARLPAQATACPSVSGSRLEERRAFGRRGLWALQGFLLGFFPLFLRSCCVGSPVA
jgi:hypothetical protein